MVAINDLTDQFLPVVSLVLDNLGDIFAKLRQAIASLRILKKASQFEASASGPKRSQEEATQAIANTQVSQAHWHGCIGNQIVGNHHRTITEPSRLNQLG